MAKTRSEKIESIKNEIGQLNALRNKLIQEQKAQERKDRTKRLCKRMGLIESLLPDTINLSDEQFKIFLDKSILTDHSRNALNRLTAQTTAPITAERADRPPQGNSTATAKTADTEPPNG